MNIGDQVRIRAGNHPATPIPRLIGKRAIVVGPGPNAQTTVRLLDGELFACYEDEMELISAQQEGGEVCQSCGESVGCVWSAPEKLWKEVTGSKDGGILCPKCFAALVQERLHTFLYWSCDTRGYPRYSPIHMLRPWLRKMRMKLWHRRVKRKEGRP